MAGLVAALSAPPVGSRPAAHARQLDRPASALHAQDRPRRKPQSRPGRKPQSRPSGRQEGGRRPQPQVEEIVDGDPILKLLPQDAIEPVDHPRMVSAAEGDAFMRDDELVLGVVRNGEARAYSTWHLDRHEVVNDRLGPTPITATW